MCIRDRSTIPNTVIRTTTHDATLPPRNVPTVQLRRRLSSLDAPLKLLDQLLHLLSNEVLDLRTELLDLGCEILGASSDLMASLVDGLFDSFDRGDGDGDGLAGLGRVAALVHDVSVVGRPAAVPGKDLEISLACLTFGRDGKRGNSRSRCCWARQ